MILSSLGFQRNLDFVLYFCNESAIFEEAHFSMLSRLGFIFDGFCSALLWGYYHISFLVFDNVARMARGNDGS